VKPGQPHGEDGAILDLLSTETDEIEREAADIQPWFLVPLVLTGVFVLVGWLVLSGRSTEEDTSAPPTTAPLGAASASIATWPLPPADHDPRISGRPGPGSPVSQRLNNLTLVYVNDIDKPTVIDLSTGNQQELQISAERTRDTFLVEGGRLVTADPLNANLPPTDGRGLLIVVDRAVDRNASDSPLLGAVPRLCLNANGCPDLPWTSGTFGDDTTRMESVPIIGEPWVALALALNATKWTQDGRWSTFELPSEGAGIRVPTPASYTTIWLVTDRAATVEG